MTIISVSKPYRYSKDDIPSQSGLTHNCVICRVTIEFDFSEDAWLDLSGRWHSIHPYSHNHSNV